MLGVSEEMKLSELLELPEVIRCVLLCTLEEDGSFPLWQCSRYSPPPHAVKMTSH